MERRWIVGEREYCVELPARAEPSFRGEATATVTVDGVEHRIELLEIGAHGLDMVVDGRRVVVATAKADEGLWVSVGGRTRLVRSARSRSRGAGGLEDGPRRVTPSFPAKVVSVRVSLGDEVERGQALVVVSAMKMEMTLEAPHAGVVVEVNVEEGQTVGPGDELVVIEAREPGSEGGDVRQ